MGRIGLPSSRISVRKTSINLKTPYSFSVHSQGVHSQQARLATVSRIFCAKRSTVAERYER